MVEIWKPIKNYENLYVISNLGNIKSLDKKDSIGRKIKGKYMKPIKRKDGYLDILLRKNNHSKRFLIHRLVAQTFIENKNNYKEINHKDENKSNNCVKNLEWCNRKYNINYGMANKKRKETLLNKNGKAINQIDKNNNIIKQYSSLMEAHRKTKLNKSHLSECCNGIRKTTGGFKWEYIVN